MKRFFGTKKYRLKSRFNPWEIRGREKNKNQK